MASSEHSNDPGRELIGVVDVVGLTPTFFRVIWPADPRLSSWKRKPPWISLFVCFVGPVMFLYRLTLYVSMAAARATGPSLCQFLVNPKALASSSTYVCIGFK